MKQIQMAKIFVSLGLTFESDVKLKYWNAIAKTKKEIPTTIPSDSGLQNTMKYQKVHKKGIWDLKLGNIDVL